MRSLFNRRALLGEIKHVHARLNVGTGASSFPRSESSSNRSSGFTDSSGQNRSSQRLAQLFELVQETGEIAVATGPKGLQRAIQGASAVATIAQQYLQSGTNPLDAPQVVLRKLFERLGATYIKVMDAQS